MNWKAHVTACMVLAGAIAGPAAAMDWTILDVSLFNEFAADGANYAYPRMATAPRGIKVYLGRGEIVPGDAETLFQLYQSAEGGDASAFGAIVPTRHAFPEVWLDSPGGDSVEGMRIGRVIRKLQLASVVPEGAFCASSCTTAFLGGVQRRVEGPFLIHAAHPTNTEMGVNDLVDTLQALSSQYIDYTQQMIGDPTMANVALNFGAGKDADGDYGALQLDDTDLRDLSVITVAARPTQGYAPEEIHTIDCAAATPATVSTLVCNDITLGRYDARMTLALAALADNQAAAETVAKQSRWQAVRDACEEKMRDGIAVIPGMQADGTYVPLSDADAMSFVIGELFKRAQTKADGSGIYAVHDCLFRVYNLRVRELEAVTDAAQAAGWE